MAVDQIILDALAPKGVLSAGINMANFHLVSGACPDGSPEVMLGDERVCEFREKVS